MTDPIAFQSATALASLIRQSELSATELLDFYLKRVEKHNADINAIVVLDFERAHERAAQLDKAAIRGRWAGPFHGVPMTIKESYGVAGLPTTFGFAAFADNLADEDALSVQRLKDAGVVIFGKTNVPVALADFQSYNDLYGTTSNPWNHDRTPGGSSGGSAAALAAGLTGFESGSDIGGSIRNPAHFCGVFGHKPTYNLLPLLGHTLINGARLATEISVVGPLARSADDLYTALNIMAGPDDIMSRGFKLSLPKLAARSLSELRIAVWNNDEQAPVSYEVAQKVDQVADAIRQAGGKVSVDRPDFDPTVYHETYMTLLQATMGSRQPKPEYEKMLASVRALDPSDTSNKAQILKWQVASVYTFNQANELRSQFRWQWHDFFKQYDAILTPVMASSAFLHDHGPQSERTIDVNEQKRPYFEQVFWCGLASSCCLPSTVIPTGLDSQGLPIGVQIIGPEYSDLQTIGIAQLLEKEGFRFTPPPACKDTV